MDTWRSVAKVVIILFFLLWQCPGFAAGWLDNDRFLLQRGRSLYQSGQFAEALKPISDAIALNPNFAEAYYWRALCFNSINKTEKALADLSTAIELANDVPTFYMSRGLIYSNQNKFDLAVIDFDKALVLDPSLQDAMTNKEFCQKEIARQHELAEKQADSKVTTAKIADETKGDDLVNNEGGLKNSAPAKDGQDGNQERSATEPAKPEDRALATQLVKERQEAEKQAKAERQAREKLAAQNAQAEQELTEKLARERQERARIEHELSEAKKSQKSSKQKAIATASADESQQRENGESETDAVADLEANRPIKDKWALIVGISKFQNSDLNLHYPAKDARDFYNFLTTKGNFASDHVKLLVDQDATRGNILSLLGDKWLPRVANPDDLVVIYISSHGSSSDLDVGGVNYLLAYDSDVDNLYASGLPMQDLTRIIKGRVHSDRVVMILDACHSGAVSADSKGLSRGGNVNADEIAQGTGQLVISSSAPNQVSWESKQDENSVFTKYLMEGLTQQGGKTSLGDAFQFMKDRVQEEVLRERGVLQTPVLKSKWKGKDLVIAAPAVNPRPGLPIGIGSSPTNSDAKVAH